MTKDRDVALLTDTGDTYRILNISTMESVSQEGAEAIVPISYNTREFIINSLSEGKELHIPKEDINTEITVGSIVVSEASDDLALRKNLEILNLHRTFTHTTTAVKNYDTFAMISISGKLASKGYEIKDPTRQESYIDILNSGDDEAVTLLTKYTDIYEKVNKNFELYEECEALILKVTNADTIEELDALDLTLYNL